MINNLQVPAICFNTPTVWLFANSRWFPHKVHKNKEEILAPDFWHRRHSQLPSYPPVHKYLLALCRSILNAEFLLFDNFLSIFILLLVWYVCKHLMPKYSLENILPENLLVKPNSIAFFLCLFSFLEGVSFILSRAW